jgi:potassium efflux system protein
LADSYYGKDGLATALRERQASLEEVYARLGRLEKLYGEQLRALERMSSFVVARIYWVRSDPPISSKSFEEAAQELKRLTSMYSRREVWDAVGRSYSRAPATFLAVCFGALAIVVSAFFLFRRARSFRKAVVKQEGGTRKVVVHILVALLVSACIPAAILLVSVLIRSLGLPDIVARPLSRVLPPLALLVFVMSTAWRFLGQDRIAVSDLRLPSDVAAQLLRSIKIATTGAIFFYLPYAIFAGAPFTFVWMPRLLFTAFEATVLVAFMLVARRQGAFVRTCTRPAGSIYRAWAIVGPLVTLGLLAILVMDVLGYRFGAERFLWSAAQTFIAAVLLVGLHRVLQRTAEGIAYQVRRRTVKEEGSGAAWESSKLVLRQLTRVVSVGVIVLTVYLLASFWDLDVGVRELLDGVHLTQVGTDSYLTLWNVFVALLWIFAGHFVVHNLSGIYQFMVLPFIGTAEPGGQYVFIALSRYLILLVAYSAALLTLRFSFTSLGWLLAAASVGLGFGLQEIVANFTSGLILLVERPVRVGDIITVGDTGGTVDKINIRATAVTNWDRQQIIIPNKEFITQRLTNWTRNDENVRRKITVGVAYKSDVAKVLRLLREIVSNHPKVLKDPETKFWFDDFGDSSLNFEIWFFAPVWEGKAAQTELRETIHRRFKEEGVEIAFPQRDLHIRSVDEPEAMAALLESKRTEPVE